ncbi:hypothetical protein ES705_03947 [subsurface metagenome]
MDPYASKMFKKNPYTQKRIIEGSMVVIFDASLEHRGLDLIAPISRVLNKNEIHELILTDEKNVVPKSIVNSIAYIGFFEVKKGGVIVVGDEVYVGEKLIGKVVGFDDTHIPNHQNVILCSHKKKTGAELKINLEDEVKVLTKKQKIK